MSLPEIELQDETVNPRIRKTTTPKEKTQKKKTINEMKEM